MERYKVDGDQLRRLYQGETFLKDIFRDIERELQSEQRVVCRFIVNGLSIEEKDEARFAQLSLSEVETLEYLSEKSDQLLIGVVDGWVDALPELISAAERLALRLQKESPIGVLKDVHDLMENTQHLISSLWSARQLLGDQFGAFLQEFDRVDANTQKTVQEVMKHIEVQDFVHLSATIEYDFNHCLEEWRRILLDFQALAKNKGENASGAEISGGPVAVGRGKGSH